MLLLIYIWTRSTPLLVYARKKIRTVTSPSTHSLPFHFGTQPLLELPCPSPPLFFSQPTHPPRQLNSYKFRTKLVRVCTNLYRIAFTISPAAPVSSTSLPKNTPGTYTLLLLHNSAFPHTPVVSASRPRGTKQCLLRTGRERDRCDVQKMGNVAGGPDEDDYTSTAVGDDWVGRGASGAGTESM